MPKEVLDNFGGLLMEGVRDWSIKELDGVIRGKSKSAAYRELSKYFKGFPSDTKDAFEKLVPIAVDITLHYFLFLIEGNPNLDLVMKTTDGVHSIKNESDGLSGEIYAQNGWIARFSKQRCDED